MENTQKKACITTFHFADNFGAVLQAYALSSVIENYDVDVEIINFVSRSLRNQYDLFINIREWLNKYGVMKTIDIILRKVVMLKSNCEKVNNFSAFRKKYLKLSLKKYSKPSELMNENQKYDYYITGSDQVWNPRLIMDFEDVYFLNFAGENSTRISYAASIAEEITEQQGDSFRKYIPLFDYISLREKSAVELLANLTEKNIKVTLDPTLLLDKEQWAKIATNRNITDKYILVYDLVVNQEIIEIANHIAKKLNCKIISYSRRKNRYYNRESCFFSSNPTDFLGLIQNAEIIITNSFHGTVFSVIYNKTFYTIPPPTKGSRMIDLLNELDLTNRIVRDVKELEYPEFYINYSEVNKKLSKLKVESMQFLESALGLEM